MATLASTQGQTVIQAKYLEETELVSVVAHLADVAGYVWDAEEAGVYDYFEDVNKAFAPYKNHPDVYSMTTILISISSIGLSARPVAEVVTVDGSLVI